MCGIAGYIHLNNMPASGVILQKMTDAIKHRGPDGQGHFVDGNKVTIGNNVKIQNNVSVYDNVIIEDDVFCGPSMVFTNVYNPRSGISRKDEYRDTLVKRGATIGANATIVCGATLGKYSFIAAGAVVNKDIPNYALMAGVPAKQLGWMSEFGERLDLHLTENDSTTCEHTGALYQLVNGQVSKIESE